MTLVELHTPHTLHAQYKKVTTAWHRAIRLMIYAIGIFPLNSRLKRLMLFKYTHIIAS